MLDAHKPSMYLRLLLESEEYKDRLTFIQGSPLLAKVMPPHSRVTACPRPLCTALLGHDLGQDRLPVSVCLTVVTVDDDAWGFSLTGR